MPILHRVFWIALHRIRGAIASNLEPVLGAAGLPERWRRALRTMSAFGWCLAERYRSLASARALPGHVER